jgi:hypothetical protein
MNPSSEIVMCRPASAERELDGTRDFAFGPCQVRGLVDHNAQAAAAVEPVRVDSR